MDFLRNSPSVCFEVDECLGIAPGSSPCESGTIYRSVIAFGTPQIVTNPEKKTSILRGEICWGSNGPEIDHTNGRPVPFLSWERKSDSEDQSRKNHRKALGTYYQRTRRFNHLWSRWYTARAPAHCVSRRNDSAEIVS